MRIVPLLASVLAPAALWAQNPPDTLRQHTDTLTHHAPVHLEEITVTAAATPVDVPMSVVKLTPRVINTTVANDPWDLLRLAAGVEVHEQGQGPGFASNASIRGFSSDHSTDLALWIDGVPINEPVNGHAEGYNDWSLLMPQAVATLEVIEGPTSALYGNFALAGAVNVRTRERMSGSEFALNGGANGRVDGTFFTGLDRTRTGLVLGVRGMRDGGWRPNAEQHLGQFYGRLVQQVSDRATFDVGAQLYGAGWDSPGFLTTEQFHARDYRNISDPTDGGFKRHGIERASLRVIVGNSSVWRTTVYSTQGNWNFYLTTPPEGGSGEGSGSQTEEIDRRTGWGATSAMTVANDRAEATFGVEGRLDHADFSRWLTTSREREAADLLVKARQASGAMFVQSSADLGHHVRLTAGARYDVLDTRSTPAGEASRSASHGIFSPKLGLLVHLRHAADLYANVSRGFRSTDGVIEDPTLPFISEWAYEAGTHVALSRVNATIALFQNDVSNEQTFDPITLTSSNGGRSRRKGVQVSFAAALAPAVRLNGSWTFTDAKYRDRTTEEGDNLAGLHVFNTARYVGSSALELGPRTAPWSVTVSGNVVGPYTPFDEPGIELPAYGLLHANLQYVIGNTVLRLGVRNLLDKAYPEVRAGGFVVPGQPRSLYGGVKYVM